ncbi:MAG TPA: hypothetical protein VNO21_16975 [Polyangiaceae bacterium]|nr:hypothetical protein [Polyangiaceae bacterium]
MMALHRAVLFACIALAVPLAACKLLSKGEEADAGPSQPVATAATAPPAQTQAQATAAPLAPAEPATSTASATHRRVVVKFPDGGTGTVEAPVNPDGGFALPPGFQLPTFAGFDASSIKLPPFNSTGLPPIPSTFPKIPGFGLPDGGK